MMYILYVHVLLHVIQYLICILSTHFHEHWYKSLCCFNGTNRQNNTSSIVFVIFKDTLQIYHHDQFISSTLRSLAYFTSVLNKMMNIGLFLTCNYICLWRVHQIKYLIFILQHLGQRQPITVFISVIFSCNPDNTFLYREKPTKMHCAPYMVYIKHTLW